MVMSVREVREVRDRPLHSSAPNHPTLDCSQSVHAGEEKKCNEKSRTSRTSWTGAAGAGAPDQGKRVVSALASIAMACLVLVFGGGAVPPPARKLLLWIDCDKPVPAGGASYGTGTLARAEMRK